LSWLHFNLRKFFGGKRNMPDLFIMKDYPTHNHSACSEGKKDIVRGECMTAQLMTLTDQTPIKPQKTSTSAHRVLVARGARRSPVARRRGQALLMSVLLMVFAAVLGATFVTVVALNLSQTARSSSVNNARVAAEAGRNYVNGQLTNSTLGELWRPFDASTAPLNASDPSYTYYFTDYERAQGWDQQGFTKFPDPRTTSTARGVQPVFLTKVERVIAPNTTDPQYERNGQLKVTVIGRSQDNDAAAYTLTFYKATSKNGNFTIPSRYVSNWDFTKGQIKDSALNPANAAYQPTKLVGQLLALDSEGNASGLEGTNAPQQTARGGILVHGDALFQGKSRYVVSSAQDLIQVTGNLGVEANAIPQITDDPVAGTPVIIPPSSDTTTPRTGLLAQVRAGQTNSNPTSRLAGVRTITPARIDSPNSRWRQLSQLADVNGGSQYGYGNGGVYIDNRDDVEAVAITDANTGATQYRKLSVLETQRLLQRKSFRVLTPAYNHGP
jgi:hypothetical protein